jgi:hypothetical protein
MQRLAAKGVHDATAGIVVAELASQNDLAAQRIYEIIQAVQTPNRSAGQRSESGHRPGGGGAGGGPGRMTLREFCESRAIDVTEAQARLEARGITVTPGRTLRDIAVDNGYDRPYELLDIIEGKTP